MLDYRYVLSHIDVHGADDQTEGLLHGMHPLYQLGYISYLKTECFVCLKKKAGKERKKKKTPEEENSISVIPV